MANYICNREECFAYDTFRENNCHCLNTVEKAGEGCSFYKLKTAKCNRKVIERDIANYTAMKIN